MEKKKGPAAGKTSARKGTSFSGNTAAGRNAAAEEIGTAAENGRADENGATDENGTAVENGIAAKNGAAERKSGGEKKAPARAKAPAKDGSAAENRKDEPVREIGHGALAKIWSRRMALIGLKRIYETALAGARTEIRDEDGALIEVKFNPSAANAATKAIEVANRMMGYAAPEDAHDTADLSLRVEFGDWEEYAE